MTSLVEFKKICEEVNAVAVIDEDTLLYKTAEEREKVINRNGAYLVSDIPDAYDFYDYPFLNRIKVPQKLYIDKEKVSTYSFSADNVELKDKLESWGYEVEKQGGSGFAARNKFVVKVPEDMIHEVKGNIIFWGSSYVDEKGVERKRKEELNLFKGFTFYYNNIGEVIEKAKEAVLEEQADKVIESLPKDNVFYIEVGGRGIVDHDIMEVVEKKCGLVPVWDKQTKISDHRQGITSTYLTAYVRAGANKTFNVKVPEDIIGKVIGKGGSRIKDISKKAKGFIKLESVSSVEAIL